MPRRLSCLLSLLLFPAAGCPEGGDDGGASGDETADTETGSGTEGGDGDGDGEGLACADIHDCVEACAGATECEVGCREMGSPAGQAEFDAVEACHEEHQVMSPGGVAEHCAAEMAACLAEGTGELGCGDVSTCTDGCTDDEACEQACFDDGTAAAQVQWIELVFCLFEHCPSFAGNCVMQEVGPGGACEAAYAACFA